MKVDIKVLGVPELEKQLGNIVEKTQKTIVKGALSKESKRVRSRIADAITRLGLIKTGKMLAAYAKAKIKNASKYKNFIRLGIENPTREELGISPDDKHYYPNALEYGKHGKGAIPFIRPTVDGNKEKSFADIASDIGKGIEKAVK